MNINQNDSQLYGVHQGVLYGQNERVEELNERLTSRNLSDTPLKPNYDPRPVPTKYSHFPIINRRAQSNEPAINFIDHNVSVNFNPGSDRAPPAGYSNKIDVENALRNQFFAIQNTDQNVYIPSSASDLYKTTIVSKPTEQPYPLLFQQQQFSKNLHPNLLDTNIGNDKFYNHTRTQLRNSA